MKHNTDKDSSIYKIFVNLQQKEIACDDSFSVASLPFTKKHKIGISREKYPMFFVECENITINALDINLKLISILFNKTCRLHENKKQSDNIYTIISLKTDSIDLQQYFIEVICIVLKQLPENFSNKQLKTEILKLENLFSSFNRPARKTTQGLWAELFVIEQAKYPEYLIQSWHFVPNDTYDFNDGQDKIEVKSTSAIRRIHRFTLEQLNPGENARLLIASVFVVRTGRGKNIFDLINSISKRIQDLQLQFRLNEIVSKTLGSDFDKVFDVYFDYQQAHDTLVYFDFKDVPTINKDDIPKEVSNVHLDCDLSHISAIKNTGFDVSQSTLFRSVHI
jgi:hypothetical protein